MDKIKKVFSPGKTTDDEVMYGTPSKEGSSTAPQTQAPQSSTIHTQPEAESKDKGIWRQIGNPGGDKHSDQSYGTTATTANPTSSSHPSALQSQPEAEQKDKGVFRQIFNPGGDKHSDIAYGTTASSNPGMADQLQKEPASSEPLRGAETSQYNNDQVMQEPYDSTSTTYAPTGTTSTGPSTMAREDNQDDVSNATYTSRSYALGSGQSANPLQTSSHVDQATRATTDLGPTGEDDSRLHAGRRLDHSLAGAGTGGAGAGYVNQDELNEFMKHGRDPEADQATYTSRDQYIGSSTDADPFNRPGHELAGSGMPPGHVPGEYPRDDGYDPHSSYSGIGGGSAATAGLGSGAAGVAASRADDRGVMGSEYPAKTSNSPIQTTTNTMRSGSSSKPSQGTGWDPDQNENNSGLDSSGFKGALAAASAAMGFGGAGAYAASRDDKDQSSSRPTESLPASQTSRSVDPSSVMPSSGQTSTTQPESTPATTSRSGDDHTTRNAALGAGGLGAAGAGAYAMGRDENPSSGTGTAESVVSPETQQYTHHNPSDRDASLAGQTTRSSAPTSEYQTRQPEGSDHTARNAALGAGGLGAAGAGAYGLSRDDEPSSRDTPTGNAESVVSDQTQRYTGHNPSDSDPAAQGRSIPTTESSSRRPEDDHTARNAALGAGGLGAAGAGAYGLSRDDEPRSRNTTNDNSFSPSSPSSTNTGTAQSVVSEKTQSYARHRPSDRDSDLKGAVTSSPSSQSQPIPHSAQSGQIPASQTSSRQTEEDHTARNAALGAGGLGAVGAGAYALGNRDEGSNTGDAQSVVSPDTQRYTGHNPSDRDPSYRSTGASAPTSQTLPTRSAEPTSQYQRPEDNTSRNAALGAGALGATGAGAYASGNRDEGTNAGNGQSVVSPETQKYTRHHPSDTDSSYRSTGASAPTSQNEPIPHSAQFAQPSSRQPEEDHTARNAALGAGGLGAAGAGAGAYYMGRDDDKAALDPSTASRETQPYGQTPRETVRTTEPAPTSKTTKPASSSKPKEVAAPRHVKEETPSTVDTRDPRYDPRYAAQPQEEDHTARNAALGAGGLGAAGAGAGAYYMGRDNDKSAISPESQRYAGSQPTGSYGYPSDRLDDSAMESSVFGAGAPSSSARDRSTMHDPREEDHSTRNAALGAGGVGAAGAGAYGLSQRNDTGPASKTLGPHESNAANVMDPRVKPEPTQQYQKYTEGPYDSNIANRMDPKVTSDPARARQQEPEHHYGRDAAVVGGTGAAGYGAYEYANRDQPQQSTQGYNPSDYRDPSEKYDPPQRLYAAPSEHDRQEQDPRVTTDSSGHHKLHKKAVDPQQEHYDSKHDSSSSHEKEKKPSLIHRIMHPGEDKHHKEEEERRSHDQQRYAASPNVPAGPSGRQEQGGLVTEPHTGLPMDVGKYGSGHGGTDGADNIEGYHQHGQRGYDQSGRPF